jgi:hypothetical protein
MNPFAIVDADLGPVPGGVASARHLEVPITGPGRANLLVIANGIAIFDIETDEALGTEDLTAFDFLIDTDFKLKDNDALLDSSAYACLSAIQADDSTDFRVALDSTEVKVRTSNVIQLKVSGEFEGDTGIHRIGYQVNLVISRRG